MARELGDLILRALGRSPLFNAAALPLRVLPPLFNRYDVGMGFGAHVDGAIRMVPGAGIRMRADISTTLFLTDPAEYDGGELVIEDTFGQHAVKLPAGDMIVYPATSLHRVEPITRGSRWSAFFWTQSMVKDDGAARAALRPRPRHHGRARRALRRQPGGDRAHQLPTTTCCGAGPSCDAPWEPEARARSDAPPG